MAKSDDEKLIEAATAEVIRAGDRPLTVEADLITWFDLVAVVQLGLRAPGVMRTPPAQRTKKFMHELIHQLDPDHGNLWKLLNLGFDPNHDV
jgi:hypothetical protein